MDKMYFYDTIEECEKEIVSKSMIYDMMHTATTNMFECFVRTIRTIMIWVILLSVPVRWVNYGYLSGMKLFGMLLVVYIIGATLMSWVKFCHNKSYADTKVQLVYNMVRACKEYNEGDFEDWQKTQMLKRFAAMAHIEA